MAPGIGRADEKPLKRVSAKARPGLCHRAGRHHPTVSTGQRKLEPVHDFRQRLVSHQRHAHYQPDDLLCGQPPPSNRGRSRGGKCFLYPLGGQPLTNAVKMARRDRRQIGKRLAETRRFRDAHNRILILRTGNATTLPTVAKSVRKIDLLRLNRSVLPLSAPRTCAFEVLRTPLRRTLLDLRPSRIVDRRPVMGRTSTRAFAPVNRDDRYYFRPAPFWTTRCISGGSALLLCRPAWRGRAPFSLWNAFSASRRAKAAGREVRHAGAMDHPSPYVSRS